MPPSKFKVDNLVKNPAEYEDLSSLQLTELQDSKKYLEVGSEQRSSSDSSAWRRRELCVKNIVLFIKSGIFFHF